MNSGHVLLSYCAALLLSTAVVSAKITPVRIEQTVEAQFPASLSFTPITSGEARVMINVDADGHLADLMVMGYTHKAFADEAVALLKRWRYSPATVDGQPVGIRMELRINFMATGRIVSLTAVDTPDALIRNISPVALVMRVCTARELDQPIEVLKVVSPDHPGKAIKGIAATGTALVDFYVDEHGSIRMPVVVKTTDMTYAQAAVGALGKWRFSTPTRQGKPVAVRVQQQFVFSDTAS